eukprot:6197204-Pleurochrysis_carterae.AAC.5
MRGDSRAIPKLKERRAEQRTAPCDWHRRVSDHFHGARPRNAFACAHTACRDIACGTAARRPRRSQDARHSNAHAHTLKKLQRAV